MSDAKDILCDVGKDVGKDADSQPARTPTTKVSPVTFIILCSMVQSVHVGASQVEETG